MIDYMTKRIHFDKNLGLKVVTITMTELGFERAEKDSAWLECIENAGVDNWGGIDFAKESMEELYGEDW